MNEPKKFVIQRHERQNEPLRQAQGKAIHWDLMLESGDILETYRIDLEPEQWGREPIKAVKIFDHPVKFLTYQGSVNKGKGSVSIADYGIYRVIKRLEDRLGLDLTGNVLKGKFLLDIVK
jgi:bifunctional non-homologous end joining protein LigD